MSNITYDPAEFGIEGSYVNSVDWLKTIDLPIDLLPKDAKDQIRFEFRVADTLRKEWMVRPGIRYSRVNGHINQFCIGDGNTCKLAVLPGTFVCSIHYGTNSEWYYGKYRWTFRDNEFRSICRLRPCDAPPTTLGLCKMHIMVLMKTTRPGPIN